MQDPDRRGFLKVGGAVLATGMVAGLRAAHAEEHMSQKGADALAVKSQKQGVCATCQYWGGIRRAAEDKSTVYCESLGWCNNPKSRNYQSKTTPITGPMESWKKWDAI